MIEHGLNLVEITIIDSGIVKELRGRIISWLDSGTEILVDARLQRGQKLALKIFNVDSEISSVISSFDSDEPHKTDIEVRGIVESADRKGDDSEDWIIQVRFFGKVRILRSARG
jgi:hypothetical protein